MENNINEKETIQNEDLNCDNNIYKENESINTLSDNDIIKYIGYSNTEYYFKQFKNNKDKKNFASWNWASFFLGGYWLLYRKLYGSFIVVLIASLLGNAIFDPISSTISIIFNLAIMILLGVFGNCIYINNGIKKMLSLKRFFSKHGNVDHALEVNGGTNIVAPLVLLGVILLLVLIVSSVFSSIISTIASFPF